MYTLQLLTLIPDHVQISQSRAAEILGQTQDHSLATLKHLYNKEVYTQITTHTPSYFLIQTSGQKTPEYLSLKSTLKTKGFRMLKPSSTTLAQIVPPLLQPMCMGPMSLIYTSTDIQGQSESAGGKMRYIVDLCQKSGGKMCLLGGFVEGESLSRDGIVAIMHLPAIEVMRAELVGVLGERARSLVGVLGRHQEELCSVLERRE